MSDFKRAYRQAAKGKGQKRRTRAKEQNEGRYRDDSLARDAQKARQQAEALQRHIQGMAARANKAKAEDNAYRFLPDRISVALDHIESVVDRMKSAEFITKDPF